ncbi:MAG TPA: DUF5667 domain-containing protein [Patescibacteria group bacterium]|nr:DUF5667 domain-containing protein [Patescibacteria group bacterium]
MKNKIAGISTTILIAFAILLISVFRSASPKFAYSPIVLSERTTVEKSTSIDYALAYQGKILPDNPFWYLKVLRDKTWLAITFNNAKKAEINLLFADKRLGSSLELFKNNKPDLGLSTLTKSGKYLESAELIMGDDKDFYRKIAIASLKHVEVIENEILPLSPEDIKPEVIKVRNHSKETYTKIRDHMLSVGLVPPENPFETK